MRLSGRDFEHTRTHVELCCGRYLSSLIYHLQADRAARALAIDIEEWAVIRDRIPVALRPRILYVQRDVEHLTYDELDKLCHQAFGAHVGLSQVSTVHWSPPCETMSVSLSKRGRQKHRHPDGRAKSATAVKHDSCFENVIGILERLVAGPGRGVHGRDGLRAADLADDVEQHHLRLDGQSTGNRHTLLLAT